MFLADFTVTVAEKLLHILVSYFCSFDHIKRLIGVKTQADHHVCTDKPPAEPDDQNSNMITVYWTNSWFNFD